MQRRQKASDVFRETEFLIARKTSSFSEAFPDVEDVEVEITEEGRLSEWTTDRTRTTTYTKTDFPGEYVDCSNPLCHGGGVRIAQLVRNMGYGRQQELEEARLCRGQEGSPKGRRVYGPCDNYFKVKIKISYHTDTPDD